MDLKTLLVAVRQAKGLSQRDVWERTNHGVSPGYLSQLETGEARSPSPHILHKLARVYGVEYMELMRAAGYVKAKHDDIDASRRLAGVAWNLIQGLTEEEQAKVLDFMQYLQIRRREHK